MVFALHNEIYESTVNAAAQQRLGTSLLSHSAKRPGTNSLCEACESINSERWLGRNRYFSSFHKKLCYCTHLWPHGVVFVQLQDSSYSYRTPKVEERLEKIFSNLRPGVFVDHDFFLKFWPITLGYERYGTEALGHHDLSQPHPSPTPV